VTGTRKAISSVIIALGAICAVIVLRGVACSRHSVPLPREATGTEWELPFKCNKCGEEFVGYVVGLEPGTKPRDGKRRYKRPGDDKWVPVADGAGVAAIKTVTCPKCGAGMRDLTLKAGEIAGGNPMF